MSVTVTESATEYLKSIAQENSQRYVRLAVAGGGCAGFQYQWDFVDTPDDNDATIELSEDSALVIDHTSEMYLLGSTVDYVKQLGGSYLEVRNPLAQSGCGCGESFSMVPDFDDYGDFS